MPHIPGHVFETPEGAAPSQSVLDFLTRAGVDTSAILTQGSARAMVQRVTSGRFSSSRVIPTLPVPEGGFGLNPLPGQTAVTTGPPGGLTSVLSGIRKKPSAEGDVVKLPSDATPVITEPPALPDKEPVITELPEFGGLFGAQPSTGIDPIRGERIEQFEEPLIVAGVDINAILRGGAQGTLSFNQRDRVRRVITELDNATALNRDNVARLTALAGVTGLDPEVATQLLDDLEVAQRQLTENQNAAQTLQNALDRAITRQTEFETEWTGFREENELTAAFDTLLRTLFPQQDVSPEAFFGLPAIAQSTILSNLFATREAREVRERSESEQAGVLDFLQQLFPNLDITESILDVPVGVLNFLQGFRPASGPQLLTTTFSR